MGGRGASAGLKGGANSAQQTTQGPQKIQLQPQIQKTAKSINNIADLRTYAKQNLGLELGKSLDTVDYGLVQQAVSDYEFFKSEFPQWDGTLQKIQARQTRPGVNAETNGTTVTLSQQQYSNPGKFAQVVSAAASRHYYPENTTNKTTAVHELGHTFEQAMINKIMPDDGTFLRKYDRVEAWNKGVYSGKIISEAAASAKKTPGGKGKKKADLIADVSQYATKRSSETLAECVRDYYINRGNAKPLSVEVWKILKREFG